MKGWNQRQVKTFQIISASLITIYLYFYGYRRHQLCNAIFKRQQYLSRILFIPWSILFLLVIKRSESNYGLDGLAILPCILIASAFVIFAYVHGNINISEYLLYPIGGSGEVAIFAASLVGAGLGFCGLTHILQKYYGRLRIIVSWKLTWIAAIILKQELALHHEWNIYC